MPLRGAAKPVRHPPAGRAGINRTYAPGPRASTVSLSAPVSPCRTPAKTKPWARAFARSPVCMSPYARRSGIPTGGMTPRRHNGAPHACRPRTPDSAAAPRATPARTPRQTAEKQAAARDTARTNRLRTRAPDWAARLDNPGKTCARPWPPLFLPEIKQPCLASLAEGRVFAASSAFSGLRKGPENHGKPPL